MDVPLDKCQKWYYIEEFNLRVKRIVFLNILGAPSPQIGVYCMIKSHVSKHLTDTLKIRTLWYQKHYFKSI